MPTNHVIERFKSYTGLTVNIIINISKEIASASVKLCMVSRHKNSVVRTIGGH